MIRAAVIVVTGTCLQAQSFAPNNVTFGSTSYPTVFVTADFDGDGDIDVVSGTVNDLELHRNDGEGRFTAETAALATGLAPALAVVDVDGDSDADLVGCDSAAGAVPFLLRNDGGGSFARSTLVPLLQDFGQILPLDADSDGDLDLVCTAKRFWPTPVRLLKNDGNGNYTDATSSLIGVPNGSWSVAELDVDDDGREDLVFDGSPIVVARRLANGTFATTAGLMPHSAARLSVADLDGDGDLELLANQSTHLLVLRNDGGGSFAAVPTGPPNVRDLRTGDVDGDGDLDLLIHDESGFADLWRLGPGFVLTATPILDLPQRYSIYFAGDFLDSDGDGDLDLWMASSGPPLFNDGTGQLANICPPLAPRVLRAAAPADFDGDGRTDLVALTGSFLAPVLTFWRQDPPGHHELASVIATDLNLHFASRVVAFDADTDGDADVLLMLPGQDRLWRNDGGGTFTEISTMALPTDARDEFRVFPADFNNDGHLDIYATRQSHLGDSLYVNQGNGTFVDEGSTRIAVPSQSTDAAALDYDLDGDLDLVVASTTGARLYANDGQGFFALVPNSGLPAGSFLDMVVGDVDRDGDDDVILLTGSTIDLWRNTNGVFVADPGLASVPGNHLSPALADFDANGAPDLLVDDRWYHNDGNGSFTPSTQTLPHNPAHDFQRFADIDEDGDPDFLLREVQTNLHRQLINSQPPRVGYHGEITLHVQSSGPAFTILCFAPQLIAPTPSPCGLLQLDLRLASPLDSAFVAPPKSVRARRYFIPADPGLIGVSLGVQGIVLTPPTPRVTNAIRIDISQ